MRYVFLLPGLAAAYLCFSLPACRQAPSSRGAAPHLLDSLEATHAVLPERGGIYLNTITAADIGLQMHSCFPAGMARDSLIERYLQDLRKEVRSFSQKEKETLKTSLEEVAGWCRALNPRLLPADLQLIKVSGKHFGPGAFYTRRRAIIFPAGAIARPHPAELKRILLHELFHIFSRSHPRVRSSLYQELGFQPLGSAPRLPGSLQQRVLLNPDGLSMTHAIKLERGQDEVFAIPLLRAEPPCYQPGKAGYFNYLRFDLYPLARDGDDWEVQAGPAGDSPLDYRKEPSFFEQIGDLTSYIIHPDEILADQFALLMLRKHEPGRWKEEDFSAEGLRRLDEMESIIRRAR